MGIAAHTSEDVKSHIKNLLVELAECEPEEVSDTAHFQDDLDLDSLTAIELMVALDKKYNIDIPEEEFRSIENLGQSVEMVMKHLRAK